MSSRRSFRCWRTSVRQHTSCRCSTAPRFAPTSRPRVQKGAARPGARTFARRLHDQDPPQDRLRWSATRLSPDRRRSQRQPTVSAAPRARPRHHAKGRADGQRLRCQKQSTCCPSPGRRADHPCAEDHAAESRRFPKILYKGRARIEQSVGKLKRFKRIALRCEKTAENFASLVSFACSLILVKTVHRT